MAREGHTVVRLVRSGSGKKKNGKPANKEAGTEKKPAQARGESANTIDVAWNPNTCDLEGEPFGAEQEKVEGADAVVKQHAARFHEGPQRRFIDAPEAVNHPDQRRKLHDDVGESCARGRECSGAPQNDQPEQGEGGGNHE